MPQIDRAGGLLPYLGSFIAQYTSSGSHDGAPLETDAELGELMFQDFYDVITHRYGKKAIERLLSAANVSDGFKISRIRAWWELFVRVAKPAVLGIAPGFSPGRVLR